MVAHPSLLVLSAQDWCCHCAKALSLSSQGLAMPVKGRGARGGGSGGQGNQHKTSSAGHQILMSQPAVWPGTVSLTLTHSCPKMESRPT